MFDSFQSHLTLRIQRYMFLWKLTIISITSHSLVSIADASNWNGGSTYIDNWKSTGGSRKIHNSAKNSREASTTVLRPAWRRISPDANKFYEGIGLNTVNYMDHVALCPNLRVFSVSLYPCAKVPRQVLSSVRFLKDRTGQIGHAPFPVHHKTTLHLLSKRRKLVPREYLRLYYNRWRRVFHGNPGTAPVVFQSNSNFWGFTRTSDNRPTRLFAGSFFTP